MQRLRRATPIALALFLALVSGAFAGANEGATFTLTSESSVRGVGPGDTIDLEITAAGFVGVRQLDITIEASDADQFDLSASTLTLREGFLGEGFLDPMFLGAQIEPDTPNRARLGTAMPPTAGDGIAGEASFRISVPTSASFTTGTEASITVVIVSVGPDRLDRDAFDAAALALRVDINEPVMEPTLAAATDTDISADFSVDLGSGGDGEVTLGVSFADASGGTASDQEITWSVQNNGAEVVAIIAVDGVAVDSDAIEAGSSAEVVNGASITLDSAGDDSAGSTSATVTASTSAENSAGDTVVLTVEFFVTWDVPVPAELASFSGQVTADDEVFLQWTVPSQTNNLGWEVFRSVDNEVFELVSPLIAGEGTSDVFRTYEFVDASPPAAEVLYYYLRQLDLNGTASKSESIEITLGSLEVMVVPQASALLQNFPNPFNPETTIQFDLAEESFVRLRVYDATGQVVRSLVGEALPGGSYSRTWDGHNSSGARVGSGVYFYELRAGTFSSMKKMTLVQ